MIVHDGGSSFIEISFCPWCGAKLPESKRERWFNELEAKGVDLENPDVKIPERYLDDRWWKK
jgi:hypothetical protein